MIITVTSYKGGVGKTTTAIHLATYMQQLGPTLLIDGDAIRSATQWRERGKLVEMGKDGEEIITYKLPFKVVSHAMMVAHIRDHQHVIIDTEGNPSDDDFKDLAMSSDVLVIPAEPETVATDGLIHTLTKLKSLGITKHKVLLTKVAPPPRTEGKQLRDMLASLKVPVFKTEIPRLAAFEKAAAEGIPVRDVRGDRNALRAWDAYKAAGKEIMA